MEFAHQVVPCLNVRAQLRMRAAPFTASRPDGADAEARRRSRPVGPRNGSFCDLLLGGTSSFLLLLVRHLLLVAMHLLLVASYPGSPLLH